MRKTRSDAKLKTLPEYRQAAIERYALNHSLDQTVKWLRHNRLRVSANALSRFLKVRRQRKLQSELLLGIKSCADQCHEVEKAFAKNPAPKFETLIKLHRVLTFQLTKHGQADPDLLSLANKFTRTMLAALSTQTKARLGGQNLALQERRVKLLEKKAAQAEATEKVLTDRDLSPKEIQRRLRIIYGRA
ncbi:MAG: hypothetical protein ABSE16_18915 [Verrucomicrobiota bacterium]|jgi:hypothetical protein